MPRSNASASPGHRDLSAVSLLQQTVHQKNLRGHAAVQRSVILLFSHVPCRPNKTLKGMQKLPQGNLSLFVQVRHKKAGREHRVPLSDRAKQIVSTMVEGRASDFVFPGNRPGRPLSIMALELVLRRMKV